MNTHSSSKNIALSALTGLLCFVFFVTSGFANAYSNVLAVKNGDHTSSTKWTTSATLPPAPVVDLEILAPFLAVSSTKDPELKANQSPLTRAQVVSLYNALYVPGNSASIGWTGSGPATCNAGTTDATLRQRILDRLNFYRQVAGLPTISFFSGADFAVGASQASALMQGANSWSAVNPHSPPSSWFCYVANGATAAGKSNLGKGLFGVGAIDAYVDDYGGGNEPVGHRRWILYPPLAKSYSGDVSSSSSTSAANDLWVIANGSDGTWGPRPSMPNGVAWPPGGYVPYQALPDASNRWSFSWPNANMANATVTMSKNGQSIAILGYDSRDNFGYGDASVVFRPNNNAANGTAVSYANPGGDQPYEITVSNFLVGGVPQTVNYTVTVIDPAAAPSVTISGAAVGANGAAICANPASGVSCNAVSAGSYSCNVAAGWSGTLHLQAGNSNRVAARRYATAVTSAQSNQDFAVVGSTLYSCNLDIDNNGLNEASIDGVMMMRKLFGVSGSAQMVSASGVCAQRTIESERLAFLAGQNYDINNSGGAQSLLDGLILLRLMLGMTGMQAVVGTGLTWANVQTQLNNNCGTNF